MVINEMSFIEEFQGNFRGNVQRNKTRVFSRLLE
jgi:hypothetical protein